MSRRALSAELGTALMLLNLAAWGAWAFLRAPLGGTACAVLQAKRSERDQAVGDTSTFPGTYTGSEHLLFRRLARCGSRRRHPD